MLLPLRIKDLAALCRRVGTSLDAGVDVVKVWKMELDRSQMYATAAISRVCEGLQRGITLADAMSAATGVFPRLVLDVVRVGEESGHVEQAFLQLAEHYEYQLTLRRTLMMASLWPMISLVAAIGIIGIFILVLGAVNSMTGQSLDILGFGLVGVPGFIKYVAMLSLVGGGVAGLYWAGRRGKLPTEKIFGLAMAVPALRIFVQSLSLSRFAWALSLGTNSGMRLSQALKLAFAAANNSYFERHAGDVIRNTNQGRPIHESLQQTGVFPVEFVGVVEVGETAGRLPESLKKIAEQLNAQARQASFAVTIFFSVLVWCAVGFVTIAMIFKLFSFYVDTLNSAGQI
jgi:type II secretory pathway component PulF